MYLRDFLQSRDVPFGWFLHRPASAASRLASHVHVSGERVAKGVLLRGEGRFVLAVLPATRRVDLARVSQLLRGESFVIATESEVLSTFPDCERGAVPLFGRLYGLPTFVDTSLAKPGLEIIFVGNQRHEGLKLRLDDFMRLEEPVVGEISASLIVHTTRRIAG